MIQLRQIGLVVALSIALTATSACGSDEDAPPAASVELLSTSQTVLQQAIAYPTTGDAAISSSIVTLQPGDETGWHHHNTPLYAYILEGAVTVDYGADGTRTYNTGEALMEAIGTSHNGRNEGDSQLRILVVSFGAAGIEDTVLDN